MYSTPCGQTFRWQHAQEYPTMHYSGTLNQMTHINTVWCDWKPPAQTCIVRLLCLMFCTSLSFLSHTEEEISAMRAELDKYGIQMPAFGKIGGILANEMPVDEAALHAAVIAINEAIDKNVSQVTKKLIIMT